MSTTPRLEWRTYPNCFKNTNHEAKSLAFIGQWTIVSSHQMDVIRWHVTGPKGQNREGFIDVESAKEWCQAREDEAWRFANPPREYTDAEILDAIDKHDLNFLRHMQNVIEAYQSTNTHTEFRGKSHREAVVAFLRSIEGGPR